MESVLIFSEIVFYFTVSIAIILTSVLWVVIIYDLLRITRELKKVFHNINIVSNEVGEQILEALNKLSNLPILSYFLKKRSAVKNKNK